MPNETKLSMKPQLIWTPAKVGCYWHAARDCHDFSVSTRITYRDGQPVLTYPDSCYVLTCNREELSTHRTLKAAQRAAERHMRIVYCVATQLEGR